MNVLKHFWVDAVSTACFLLRGCPHRFLIGLLLTTSCFQIICCSLLIPRYLDAHALFGMSVLKSLNLIRSPSSVSLWDILVFKKGIYVIVPLFDVTLCIRMLHYLRLPHFLFRLLLRVKRQNKTCLFILLPHPLSFPNPLLSLL